MILDWLETAYARILDRRARRYATGRWPSERLSRPTISVGNLTMGGAGKTPVVALLAARLAEQGHRPAVLSRGYGRRSRGTVVVSEGGGPLVSADEGGDEPVELARRLPGVCVVVARRRAEAARVAAGLGAEVFLLDDGYQHLAVRRDLDLLLLDATDPFGGGHFPPRGRLREGIPAVSRADAVIFTRAERPAGPETLAAIARWNPSAAVFHARFRVAGPFDEQGAYAEPSGPAVAVCGVARPQTFAAALSEARVRAAELLVFPDHHRYGRSDRNRIHEALERTEAGWVVTTGKDEAKLRGRLAAPLLALRLEVEIAEPEFWTLLESRVGKNACRAGTAGGSASSR